MVTNAKTLKKIEYRNIMNNSQQHFITLSILSENN